MGQLVSAQSTDTTLYAAGFHQKWLPAGEDSLALGSLPVITESLYFTDALGDTLKVPFTFYGQNPSYIILEKAAQQNLRLHYQTIGLDLWQKFQNKDTSMIIPQTEFRERKDALYQSANPSFSPFGGLNSQGSIARSISLGNNQDAVLNSSLNLQLNGNLGNNTQIRASINDNNLPVQSDGYTQQLREFDRVYMEIENEEFGLVRAGDFNITKTNNYFLNFDKRVSGAAVLTGFDLGNGRVPIELQGGIARGKFARNRFQGQEGNQGPYKLSGANNEQFIVIISGSERVYVDGILLKRGEQNDYVIDYNAGEVTFTAQFPINKDKRIVVEFQYSDQSFLRPIYFGKTGFKNDKVATTVSYYSESDSRNQTININLTEEDQQRLSEIGDATDLAYLPSIQQVEFDADLILYELRDTLTYDSVLVYSTDSNAALYQVSFALVGSNQGDYIQANSVANGNVYEWVSPINGQPQGNYAPVRSIPVSQHLSVISTNTQINLNDHQQLTVDLALSNRDENLFSDLDDGDNLGLAGKVYYQAKLKSRKGELQTNATVEFNQEQFATVERIRTVEFARDWNLPINSNLGLVLGSAGLDYKREKARWLYNVQFLNSGEVSGLRNNMGINLNSERQQGAFKASWLTTEDTSIKSSFWREQLNYRYFVAEHWWLGTTSIGEWNLRDSLETNQMSHTSYSFLQAELFTGIGDTNNSFFEFGFRGRLDDTARGGSLQRFAQAQDWFFRAAANTKFNSRLTAFVNFRILTITQPQRLPDQQTISTRINYVQRLFKNAIVSNSFYESAAGSEPRRNYSYVEVAAGQGTHTHVDYNENGLKELNEFEVAPSPDLATYLRVFTPTSEYIRTSEVKLGQNLNIQAPSNWQQKKGFRKVIQKFSLLGNYQVERKTLLEGQTNQLDPFFEPEFDSLIIGLTNNMRGTLFYNRAKSKFGADFTIRQTQSRNLISYGLEEREVVGNELNFRYAPVQPILFRVAGIFEERNNQSAAAANRTYFIDAYQFSSSVQFQFAKDLIVLGKYEWQDQEDVSGETPNALLAQNAGVEVNWNAAQKISLRAEGRYIFNDFSGNQNSPAGYEMLQNLQPGANATFDLTLQRTLFKNIVLSVTYNGRFAKDAPAVHFGNMEVKAFF